MAQGLPQKIDKDNQIIEHDGFILSYNETCEQANWVRYVLKPSDVAKNTAKRKNYFKKDKLVETESATSSDYTKTGYDRGHLKPAADESGDQTQMNETFYMSNISPQAGGFNRGIWKTLESYARTKVVSYDSIVIITGGALSDTLKRIGPNKVCVPIAFYKVLYMYRDGALIEIEPYLMANTKLEGKIEEYLVPLRWIEKTTNLKF
jgi:endonuclease G